MDVKDQNAVRHVFKKLVYYLIGVLIVVLFLIPFLWMIFLSFKNNFGIFSEPFAFPKAWDFSLYIETFKTAHIGRMLMNSVLVTVVSVGIAMVLLYCSSYSIARLSRKGRKFSNFVYYLFIAGASIPIFGQLMSIYSLSAAIGKIIPFLGVGSKWGLVLPYIALQVPLVTLILVGGLRSVPLALEEAALIDGCSLVQVMFKVVLPTIKPVFMTALIINFLGIWNEFPIANILLTDQSQYTVPMATLMFKINYTSDYGAMLRSALMLMIPQFIFYLIFQKNIVEGMATAGIKG